jgi:hypothetical protein
MLVPTKGFRCELTAPAMEKLDRLLEEILRTLWGLNGAPAAASSAPAASGIEEAPEDEALYGRQDAAWVQITAAGIGAAADNHTHSLESLGASASNHTHDTSDFAKLTSAANSFTYSQMVVPQPIASFSGTVEWDLTAAQSAELTVVEMISDWDISNGVNGKCVLLRLSATGTDFVLWPEAKFINMDTFTLPESGKVSWLSFVYRNGALEFLGQSASFDEWGE